MGVVRYGRLPPKVVISRAGIELASEGRGRGQGKGEVRDLPLAYIITST